MAKQDNFRKKAKFKNRLAGTIISTGGYGVIIIIIAMLVFLIYQVLPLSYDAVITETDDHKSATRIKIAGIDPYQEVVYALDTYGTIRYFNKSDSLHFAGDTLSLNPNEKILSAACGQTGADYFSVGTDQGRILVANIKMRPEFQGNKRHIIPEFKLLLTFQAESKSDTIPAHIESLVYCRTEIGGQLWIWKNHMGKYFLQIQDEDNEIYHYELDKYTGNAEISVAAIDQLGEKVVLGSNKGCIYIINSGEFDNLSLLDSAKVSGVAITALGYLLGGSTLVTGDAEGRVASWLPGRHSDGTLSFDMIHQFEGHQTIVTGIAISARNRSFLSYDRNGKVLLNYGTTGQTRAKLSAGETGVTLARIAPKSNGILIVDNENRIDHYHLSDEHPAATIPSLFGKVRYEGYDKAEFVWQSTGGSDEFEPKFSLIPLIFGTLKGTLYAMLFSIPLALLAAVYVSQFAPNWMARTVKPTIEIMAALPSVVIGFLAGLYFSPVLEKYLSVAFTGIIVVPLLILVAIYIWRFVPDTVRVRVPVGWEMIFITPLVILGLVLAFYLARPVELFLFAGDIKQWLYESLGITYDQRNSIVVGFALGFAVIPTIFTISEDALSNVPSSLKSASLALGASRWQTVKYVVIPAAAGGMFAATMLGLGRAIGETMIVLMATGNTPIMDMSPFNGFRAMSACIAVEIPEAPVGGTLYHILFLTALLLFAFTFLLNTFAAFIGDRLRKKYARY